MRRNIIIEYDNDNPILPNEHLYYKTNPEYHEENKVLAVCIGMHY